MNTIDLAKKKIRRRTFLKAAGVGAVTAAGLLAGGCGLYKDDYVVSGDALSLDKGEWIPSGCAGCTSWCAKQVYVVKGRAVKIRANPHSMVHRDNSCPRENFALQQVYDPDRIKVPMRRTNPNKGKNEDPGFVPISWDEAMSEVADKLMELRDNNETHKLLVMRGRYTQLNAIIYGSVPKILGSPNNISHSSICAEAEKFGPYYTEGYWDYRDYDVENSKFVLVWGCDPLSSHRQVSHYLNSWGDLLERAEVAVIDPRYSTVASKAHHWLPVKPGEDGALALALAHEILVNGLWSREFVGDFTDNTNRFIAGQDVNEDLFEEAYTSGVVKWWNLELKDKTPPWAEVKTGIPAEKITLIAERLGKNAPGVIVWFGGGPVMQVRGAYNSMAIHALNGLLGSVDNEGGSIRGTSLPHTSLPGTDDFIDDISASGLQFPKIDQRGYKEFPALKDGKSGGGVVTNRVADAILDEDPYDIKVALGYWNNFNFSCPETDRWNKAMAKVPFMVHCGTHATEMSMFADIVLPSTHHMFEQWGYLGQKGNGYTHLWLSRPLINKIWDCKNFETGFVWLLAEKMAERGYTKLMEFCKSIKDPETGAEPTGEEEFEEFAVKFRLQPIWDPSEDQKGDQFEGWESFKEKGIWNSAKYEYRNKWGDFGTVTQKFEFYSDTLKKALQEHADRHNTSIDDILDTCKYIVTGERAFVPHYEPPYNIGDKEEYPFLLVDYKSKLNREGRSSNCTWYYEVKDVDLGDEKWNDVIKINPVDAAELGIVNGDRVQVSSPVGTIECNAKLWEGVLPGTLSKTFGQGHWAYGRVASLDFNKAIPRGGNNNDIIPADYERLSGSTAFYSVARINIKKI